MRAAQGADGVVGVGEVGVVACAEAACPQAAPALAREQRHRAHREAHVRRVAGEQVAPRRAVDREEAAPVGVAALDLGRVLGVRAGHDVVAVLLVPAEAEDVVVAAVQDAAHARAGLGAPVAVPLGERVAALAEPTGERRHVAVADRAPHRVEAQAVDLQEQHARRPVVGRGVGAAAGGAAEEDLVLVEAQHARHERGDRGHRHRHDHRGAQARDHDARDDERDGEQRRAHQQERADAQRVDRHGQRDPDDQRPDHGGEDAERQRDHGGLPPLRHREAGEPGVEQPQGEHRHDPDQQHPRDDPAAADQPPLTRPHVRCLRRSRPTRADTPATTSTSTVASRVATTGSSKIPPLTTPSTA